MHSPRQEQLDVSIEQKGSSARRGRGERQWQTLAGQGKELGLKCDTLEMPKQGKDGI